MGGKLGNVKNWIVRWMVLFYAAFHPRQKWERMVPLKADPGRYHVTCTGG